MPFDLVEPEALSEALALLDPEDGSARAVAGGTALMLMLMLCAAAVAARKSSRR